MTIFLWLMMSTLVFLVLYIILNGVYIFTMKKTGRYKIVDEFDENDHHHYELFYEYRSWFNSTRWLAVQEHHFRFTSTKRFKTIEEVYEHIKSERITREVVEEGVLL